MNKKIILDITSLSDQYKNRGIGTYTYNLVHNLVKNKEYDWCLLGFNDQKDKFKGKNIYFNSLGDVRLSTPLNLLFFKKQYLALIRKIKPDIFFAPHIERGLPIKTCTTVVTVPDITPFLTNNYSTRGILINYLKGLFYKYNLNRAKKADLIITISNFSKSILVKNGFDKEKVRVAYLGLSENFDISSLKRVKNRLSILKKYCIQKPYLLYYGGLEQNKNVDKVLLAFRNIRKSLKIDLVIVDKNLYKDGEEIVALSSDAGNIKDIIESNSLQEFIILPSFINWEDLPVVLKESEAFVHLSSFEGFGLAVLEAMSAGTPVVAANRSCYPEVLEDGAVLVDPDNIEEVTKSIIKIIKDERFRRELSKEAVKQAGEYSWKKCSDLTTKYFTEIVNN
jgi:glycosyltransferase involved in cell wall biosynthesis